MSTFGGTDQVPARWDRIRRAVEIRNIVQGDALHKTLIIGNGDLTGLTDARANVKESGADGAMLGRAIFGNPWLFSHSQECENNHGPSIGEIVRVMVEHTKLFEELLMHPSAGFGAGKSFAIMKKHYKAYLSAKALATTGVHGFEGASKLRSSLMEKVSSSEVETAVNDFLAKKNY